MKKYTVSRGYVVIDDFGRAVDWFETEEEAQEDADERNEEFKAGLDD